MILEARDFKSCEVHKVLKLTKICLATDTRLNNNIRNKRYNFFVLNYLTFKKNTILKLKKKNKLIFIWNLFDKDIKNYDNLYLIKNIK